MSQMIDIYLNGDRVQVATGIDLQQLQQQFAADQQVAIALNTEIMPRRLWTERTLQARDQVLMFNLVAGG
jgi:thiamine biosynthesis protein ThiS